MASFSLMKWSEGGGEKCSALWLGVQKVQDANCLKVELLFHFGPLPFEWEGEKGLVSVLVGGLPPHLVAFVDQDRDDVECDFIFLPLTRIKTRSEMEEKANRRVKVMYGL